MTELVYLLLGSNLGDRAGTMTKATAQLAEHHFEIVNRSSFYETQPWGIEDQPVFLNMVVVGWWRSTARSLLELCLEIEQLLGRVRNRKWGERIIDIDILYFGQQVIDDRDLRVPHPGIPERRFTLVPLSEIAPDFIHPISQQSNRELLESCPDQSGVNLYKPD